MRANPELKTLFQQDQQERQTHPLPGAPGYEAFRRRDAGRRVRVREIIAADQAKAAPTDLYYAALVLHHGGALEDVKLAHQWAKTSAERGYRPARWLTAATLDRWLMYQGHPQKYGTQIVPDGHCFRVWDTDPATTDAERRHWDVRPLAQQQARAADMTRTEPQPDMTHAPDWLQLAIKRWQATELGD